jgi:hypothetical protein
MLSKNRLLLRTCYEGQIGLTQKDHFASENWAIFGIQCHSILASVFSRFVRHSLVSSGFL